MSSVIQHDGEAKQAYWGGDGTEDPDTPRRIHVLGMGNVGKLVAFYLRGLEDPPSVVLLLRSEKMEEQFKSDGEKIGIKTRGIFDFRKGFEYEIPGQYLRESRKRDVAMGKKREHFTIQNLIVTTKAHTTASAMHVVKHRLRPDSTILFLQNGMGLLDELNRDVFPDPETRPQYMLGVNTHGVFALPRFRIIHAGIGTMALAVISKEGSPEIPTPSRPYLMETLLQTPTLGATAFSEMDLKQLQLEKLAINAVINPLTVLFNCYNGSLLSNKNIEETMVQLVNEISNIILAFPEAQGMPNARIKFSGERLYRRIVQVAQQTETNISSTLQDVKEGRLTEIDYINGYITRRADELGIDSKLNKLLMQMVKGKQRLVAEQRDDYIPLKAPEFNA